MTKKRKKVNDDNDDDSNDHYDKNNPILRINKQEKHQKQISIRNFFPPIITDTTAMIVPEMMMRMMVEEDKEEKEEDEEVTTTKTVRGGVEDSVILPKNQQQGTVFDNNSMKRPHARISLSPESSSSSSSSQLSSSFVKKNTTTTQYVDDSKKKTKKKKKIVLQQRYIDLGQRDFAKRIHCTICGMMYVHGVIEDIQQHERICKDYKHGVPFHSNYHHQKKNERVVVTVQHNASAASGCHHRSRNTNNQTKKTAYIVEIRPTDRYSLRQKVEQVKEIVDKEMGFVAPTLEQSSSMTAYLYVFEKRIVGMIIVEPKTMAYAMIVDQVTASHNMNVAMNNTSSTTTTTTTTTTYERSTEPRRAMMGIHQMWVHHAHRRMGIASRLVDVAREKMFYGLFVPKESVAFSSPTEAGIAFARRYQCNHHRSNNVVEQEKEDESVGPLVYDCCQPIPNVRDAMNDVNGWIAKK